jgi:hypothetical protein
MGAAEERVYKMKKPILRLLDSEFTIHRFRPDELIPSAVLGSSFFWIGKTDEELSVVCESSILLIGGEKDPGWSCIQAIGPIELSATGVLAGIAIALASAQISIFALSTFNTDYILVKTSKRKQAISVLTEAGYDVQSSQEGA